MNRQKIWRPLIFAFALGAIVTITAGCNIFGWTAADDDFKGYLAKGKQYMRDGEYASAKAEFEKAIEANPKSSDARYYHAKALVLAAGLNIGVLIDDLQSGDESNTLPLYSWNPADSMTSAEDIIYKNNIYQANMGAMADLAEIYEGRATGGFNSRDIQIDYAVAMSIVAIVGLRDTDQDGDIDSTDIYLTIDANPNGTYSLEGLQQFFDYNPDTSLAKSGFDPTGARFFNTLITWVDDLLTNSRALIANIIADLNPELDMQEINQLLNDFQVTMRMYYVDTGDASNPGIGDNDHDGTVNEEHWGDTINSDLDGDGFKWEDSTVEY
ncbi:MAG: hypothetical protein CO189_08340 [candidate division Zixibacteria bacterium CG_4_9_14_3_um_filter_46_8]|nr:MAG: hypothetical protein CO189_08340 [candidate division Zixibacteria bacterium CG_4_9_14_3_um_filter_46_8]